MSRLLLILWCCGMLIAASEKRPSPSNCPRSKKFGRPPPPECKGPMDPNLKPKTRLEKWFKPEMWNDFFPSANQGWGSNKCLPYSYEAFIIAARYFPEFGAGATFDAFGRPREHLSAQAISTLQKKDVAAFFGHIVQETGENNLKLFNTSSSRRSTAADCFYRGGLYQFFEGGPKSKLFTRKKHIFHLSNGEVCVEEGRYCKRSPELDFWYPCSEQTMPPNPSNNTNATMFFRGCYFGRGPLQVSWNYNYGQFQDFLHREGIEADLLGEPNTLLTRMDPPLAMLSAMWFYMTPQPPKPSMHDIITGNWKASDKNKRAGYNGSVFGPTNLVINNECGGEDSGPIAIVGGPGENRRIKAYKWFCERLGVEPGEERTLSCKDMPEGFEAVQHNYSWQPDWSDMWRSEPCDCAPAPYPGAIPYYDPKVGSGEDGEEE